MEEYIARARYEWSLEPAPELNALGMIRKVAAIAVRCMEMHHTSAREDSFAIVDDDSTSDGELRTYLGSAEGILAMQDDAYQAARREADADRASLAQRPQMRALVADFLRVSIDMEAKLAIRAAIKRDPENWWVEHHFAWGMAIRNKLRLGGFTEHQLGVKNLDNVYVSLVEQALV